MTDPNCQAPAGSSKTAPHPSISFKGNSDQPSSQSQQLSSASSYAELNFLFGVQDPAMLVPKPNRSRRKSNQGSDHTKHRRTRSGCYTCRSRRVKCDETHPICERCRKGGRDCVYPDNLTSSISSGADSSSKRTRPAARESPGSSSNDEGKEEVSDRLEAIPDEDESLEAVNNSLSVSKPGIQRSNAGQKNATRNSSETPSLVHDKGASPTPSSEGSIGYSSHQKIGDWQSKNPSFHSSSTSEKTDWSYLPPDLQFYLTFFYENITNLHYSMKSDPEDFMRTQYLDVAQGNEALLYAIVGFSAFQRTLHNPEGKIQDFLQYYNKAVSLLLKSLKRGERPSNGTLLVILQLATIEEFLGDWINLLGHQKAAFQILTQLYTPQTVMQDDMSRTIFAWYTRFDIFAALMGGFETVLSREWFSSAHEFFQRQTKLEPSALKWKIEAAIAQHRLCSTDMSLLFAKMGKGEIPPDQFNEENAEIGRQIKAWKTKLDPALQDPRFAVTDFTGARPRDPNSIVDPYLPGVIYEGPLRVMNIAMVDWLSIDIMHRYQTALTMQTQPSAELLQKAYTACQLVEALEYWPGSPPGTMVACQANIGIACLLLPRDERHSMWGRRKLAVIESHGYIYPYTFRTKMADLFRDRSCMHWWLPKDENYPPIVRSIRKFVEERTAPAKDVPAEDLRDMKAIFASLNLDDGQSSVLPGIKKEKGISTDVAVAADGPRNLQDMGDVGDNGEGDAYSLAFEDGQNHWGQNAGSYDFPK